MNLKLLNLTKNYLHCVAHNSYTMTLIMQLAVSFVQFGWSKKYIKELKEKNMRKEPRWLSLNSTVHKNVGRSRTACSLLG